MSILLQAWRVCGFSLRAMPERAHLTGIGVLGVAGVSLVLVAMLAMANGLREVYRHDGAQGRLLVLKQGATSELGSRLSGSEVDAIGELIRAVQGPQTVVSAETYFITNLVRRHRPGEVNVPVRGLSEPGMRLRPAFRLLQGRLNQPGTRELIVGARARQEYAGLDIDATVQIGREPWRVVGVFETDVLVANAELWGDPQLLQQTYDRGNAWQLVAAPLQGPEARRALERLLADDRRINATLLTEAEHHAQQSRLLALLIEGVGLAVAAGMGLVALLVAVSSMHAAVSARRRELAVLRALGFGGFPIFCSVLLEAAVLAALGSLLGGALAYLLFNGAQLSTLNLSGSFTQVPFELTVGIKTMLNAVMLAIGLGLLAGVLPALAALRGHASDALRRVG